MQEKLLDVVEVAEWLGIGKPTVYRMVEEKEIPFIRLRGRIVFDREKIVKWLEEKTCEPVG